MLLTSSGHASGRPSRQEIGGEGSPLEGRQSCGLDDKTQEYLSSEFTSAGCDQREPGRQGYLIFFLNYTFFIH